MSYNGIFISLQKEVNPTVTTPVNLEDIILSEISQSQTDPVGSHLHEVFRIVMVTWAGGRQREEIVCYGCRVEIWETEKTCRFVLQQFKYT
jgi:hypothetical protein